MDANIINSILQRQGATGTNDNINRIREFAAANPDVLERYGMGMGPGLDDNSALLRLALDKSIASTELPPPEGSVQVGQPQVMPSVQNASAPTRRSATAAPISSTPPADWTTATGHPNLGPLPSRDASAGEVAGAPQGDSGWNWLLAMLGLSSTGGMAAAANSRGRGAGAGAPNQLPTTRALPAPPDMLRLPAPAIQLPDQSAPPQAGRPTQSPEEIARLRAEVDAENAQMRDQEGNQARQLQEQIRKQKAQKNTKETLKAGSRAIRGR